MIAKRFMPRRPIANSASARAWAFAVSMFWKTCGPASVIPSWRESEMNGSCSSSAVEAARSASALVIPPRTTIAPSSSASASRADAAPSGSPRVSRTASFTCEPSSARPTPCRIASPQRLYGPESGTATPSTFGRTKVSFEMRSTIARASAA